MKKPSWTLTDVAKIAAEHPYTFDRPSEKAIHNIQPGDHVKLVFSAKEAAKQQRVATPSAERMWVLVSENDGQGNFKGKLDNDPVVIKDLTVGEGISFSACHVASASSNNEPSIIEPYFRRCFVSNQILNNGAKATLIFREETANQKDSGWRILTNGEDETHVKTDHDNHFSFVSLGAVLNRDDSFVAHLSLPAGTRLEKALNGIWPQPKKNISKP